MKKQYWKLTYRSIIDGQRHGYMNVGFSSPEAAERERDLLIKEYEKRWKDEYTDEEIINMYLNDTVMYTSIIGRDYKVEPIKVTLI